MGESGEVDRVPEVCLKPFQEAGRSGSKPFAYWDLHVLCDVFLILGGCCVDLLYTFGILAAEACAWWMRSRMIKALSPLALGTACEVVQDVGQAVTTTHGIDSCLAGRSAQPFV